MIDNKRRRELLELIDGGDLEALKKYIEEENEKYYVHQAREQLTKFFKDTSTYFCVRPDGKIQVTDRKTIFVLPRKDILPSNLQSYQYGADNLNSRVTKAFEEISEKCCHEVSLIKNDKYYPDEYKEVHYIAEHDKICIINKAFIRRAEIVLGDENIVYTVSDEPNACLLTSPRGKALILGIRE